MTVVQGMDCRCPVCSRTLVVDLRLYGAEVPLHYKLGQKRRYSTPCRGTGTPLPDDWTGYENQHSARGEK